ncbi:MAG: shikimate kinase [Candidatus Omnitrophota bacterium]|nr:MAG: shikimate kinase [Candidatus Omnitrophota bacterium]
MKNIYLVGFMGTGKTAVGKILSKKLGKEFVEMEELIEQREGRAIVDIFKTPGEDHFRKLEKELLLELSQKADLVISCGGGLICNEENLGTLKSTGTVFNLKTSAQKIYERTKKYTHRPLLNVVDPVEQIEELLKKREPFYSRAHYTVESQEQTPQEVADAIINILGNNG